jgi:hypothetical protein
MSPPGTGFDRELAGEIARAAFLAADLSPGPPSPVRNPDGSQQGETRAELIRRTVTATVAYLLETGLVVIAPDAGRCLDGPLPLPRTT